MIGNARGYRSISAKKDLGSLVDCRGQAGSPTRLHGHYVDSRPSGKSPSNRPCLLWAIEGSYLTDYRLRMAVARMPCPRLSEIGDVGTEIIEYTIIH
jgi:hypothetical protein